MQVRKMLQVTEKVIRYASKAIPLYTLNYFGLKDFPFHVCISLHL